jgi:putative endonuclease
MHYVYVLQSTKARERFYLGCTSNLKQRVRSHNQGENKATRGRRWKLVYYEAYTTLAAARKREYRLKHNGKARAALMQRIQEGLE